ncbi:hypothetical protein TNCV_1662001 [Trichonephila clavipes]|nr:hypothetical protein TNCV_1662001 [Trichonephila clavipes]
MTVTQWRQGCGSPVVQVSDQGRHVMSSSPEPLKTRRVGQRCTLNLSRAETSSRCILMSSTISSGCFQCCNGLSSSRNDAADFENSAVTTDEPNDAVTRPKL